MTPRERAVILATKHAYRKRKEVIDWTNEQAKALRLVQNDQCPEWAAYAESERRLSIAVRDLCIYELEKGETESV